MTENVLLKAIRLLFTSNSKELQFQFFGGEPLLRFDLLQKGTLYAEKLNKRFKKDMRFILTTNGIELKKNIVDFLKKHNFTIEFSIDGLIENQLKMRRAKKGKKYYKQMLKNLQYLLKTNIPHYSISVFSPNNVASLFKNFFELQRIGFQKIQINYSLGVQWPQEKIYSLFSEVKKVVDFTKKHPRIQLMNLTSARKEPVVLNSELTVDTDGGIYLESGICLEEDFLAMKSKFLLTDIYSSKDINLFSYSTFQNFYRLSSAYSETNNRFRGIILNNISLGKRFAAFLNTQSSSQNSLLNNKL